MHNITVLVNNQQVDLKGDMAIPVTKTIADVRESFDKKTDFTKSFTLLDTQETRSALGQVRNVNSVSWAGTEELPACEIWEDGVRLIKGRLIVDDVIRDENEETTYRCRVVGSGKDLFSDISDTSIRSLPWPDSSGRQFNWDGVANNQPHYSTNIGYYEGYDIGFGFLDYGNNPELSLPAAAGGEDLESFLLGSTALELSNYIRPFTYVKSIIDRIFEYYGYRYECRVFNTPWFRNLIIPHSGDQIRISEATSFEQILEAETGASGNFAEVEVLPDADGAPFKHLNGAGWLTTSSFNRFRWTRITDVYGSLSDDTTYTFQVADIVSVNVDLYLRPTLFDFTYPGEQYDVGSLDWINKVKEIYNDYYGDVELRYYRGDNEIPDLVDSKPITDLKTYLDPGTGLYTIIPDLYELRLSNIEVEEGDRIEIRARGRRFNSWLNQINRNWNAIGVGTEDEIVPGSDPEVYLFRKGGFEIFSFDFDRYLYETAILVKPNDILPDMTTRSFLISILNMFNLYMYQDDFGIYQIKERDQYYKEGEISDITSYIDPEKVNIRPYASQHRRLRYKFNDHDDIHKKRYQDLNNRDWTERSLITNNRVSGTVKTSAIEFVGTPYFDFPDLESENVFENYYASRCYFRPDSVVAVSKMGWEDTSHDPDSEVSFDTGPRILMLTPGPLEDRSAPTRPNLPHETTGGYDLTYPVYQPKTGMSNQRINFKKMGGAEELYLCTALPFDYHKLWPVNDGYLKLSFQNNFSAYTYWEGTTPVEQEGPWFNLYNYYRLGDSNIINNQARLVTVWARLSPSNFRLFDLKNKIYINFGGNVGSAWWLINRIIDYRSDQQWTKIELVRILEPSDIDLRDSYTPIIVDGEIYNGGLDKVGLDFGKIQSTEDDSGETTHGLIRPL